MIQLIVKQWLRNCHIGFFLPLMMLLVCSHSLHATPLAGTVQGLPGAAPFTPQLQQQLANALAHKGGEYKPRSKHLRNDGSPVYSNRLLLEASPYLQQHAHNPVNWFPWGDEAFNEAKRLNRPLLVSIGYSTCHWCHVMEEESYDNPEIADYLNRHFIAIKVDRESRPDIDAIYMRAVQTMTGHGGWPLNVWLLPNKQAFYGGTYFPPEGVSGRVGFLNLLKSINASYQTQSGQIKAYAQKLTQAIQRDLSAASPSLPAELNNQAINQVVAVFSANIDPFWGGVGEGVKFPSSTPIRLLLREYQHNQNAPLLDLLKLTLDKMANGGIYDHLGGGFHRYSTDPKWLVPHFEKMLYDNAQLSVTYLEAYQLTKDIKYRDIVTATLDYALREMTSDIGGFYSATDADSLNDKGELEEGWFFTWTREDIEKTLDARIAPLVADWFDIKAAGDLERRNVLHTWLKLDDFAIQQGLTPDAVRLILAEAKTTMLAERMLRPPPLRDDKIIVAWNGLMISALAKAGFVLQRKDYLAAAKKCAEFLLQELTTAGRLKRIYLQGKTQGPAFLNDYALFINALLDLYQADTQPRWLQQAIKLQKTQDELFLDKTDHQYFKTAQDSEKLLFREKPADDGVMPSGNSISAYNLLRLHKLTTDESYRKAAIRLIKAMTPRLKKHPVAMTDMLIALDFELAKGKEVVLVLAEQAGNTEAMLQVLRETYIPEHVVMIVKVGEQLRANAAVSPLLQGKRAMAGKTTAFVCKDRVCKLPSSDPDEFKQQLLVQ